MRLEDLHSLTWEMGIGFFYGIITGILRVFLLKLGFRVIYDAASCFEVRVDSVLRKKNWIWKACQV